MTNRSCNSWPFGVHFFGQNHLNRLLFYCNVVVLISCVVSLANWALIRPLSGGGGCCCFWIVAVPCRTWYPQTPTKTVVPKKGRCSGVPENCVGIDVRGCNHFAYLFMTFLFLATGDVVHRVRAKILRMTLNSLYVVRFFLKSIKSESIESKEKESVQLIKQSVGERTDRAVFLAGRTQSFSE